MGPQASVRFYGACIELSKKKYRARLNSDYPSILLSNLPVPDFICNLEQEETAVRQVEAEIEFFVRAGVDLIVLTCNTMHLHAKRFEQKAQGRFLSMIDAVVEQLQQDGVTKVGLLGSPITLHSGLYQAPLQGGGIESVLPPVEKQQAIGEVILRVIAGLADTNDLELMNQALIELKEAGAFGAILGCTDLSLFKPFLDLPVTFRLYDSLEILAEKACFHVYSG